MLRQNINIIMLRYSYGLLKSRISNLKIASNYI